MLEISDVLAASARTAGRVRVTPVAKAGGETLPGLVWYKCEYIQHTGTFKARGAFNRVLSAMEQGLVDLSVGVVIASGGNAGLAVAYAAREVGVPATVFLPESAPAVKVAKLRTYGAKVVQQGAQYAHAHEAAVRHASDNGAVYCHAYDQTEVAAGAGTLGLELRDQLDGSLDTVIVAVGGGGLMAGVAVALDGVARVVAVEPERAPTLNAALKAGEPVDVGVGGIAADSLGARRVGDIAYSVAKRTGVTSVLVTDEEIVKARRTLWEHWRIVVEHGAAAALAAMTGGAYRPEPGERVVVVLCGANTDPADL